MVSCVDRLQVLLEEKEILKSRFKPEDTGHLRTAYSVLSERVEEVKKNIEMKLERTKENGV